MEIYLTIDDTDNLESIGTGELCENIASHIEAKGWGHCSGITRHQLYVHEDIPYTSHNSSMCFRAHIDEKKLPAIIDFASRFLESESAQGSDPGLCVLDAESLDTPHLLMDFGKKAKKQVLTKDEAYTLAKKLNIHLSEHGGTGDGIIGALAGTGLRMTGNDGRFKGHHQISSSDGTATVAALLQHERIDMVRGLQGQLLEMTTPISLSKKVKTVLLHDQAVLLVYQDEDKIWRNCTKQHLKGY